MEHSKNFEKVKKFFDKGLWSKQRVYNAVSKPPGGSPVSPSLFPIRFSFFFLASFSFWFIRFWFLLTTFFSFFEKVKKFFDKGLWSKQRVYNAVSNPTSGPWITEAE